MRLSVIILSAQLDNVLRFILTNDSLQYLDVLAGYAHNNEGIEFNFLISLKTTSCCFLNAGLILHLIETEKIFFNLAVGADFNFLDVVALDVFNFFTILFLFFIVNI